MKQDIKAREGDLIETLDGNIFDVKGIIHPRRKVVAFIRYVPDPNGDRKRDEVTYKKVYALKERYALLKKFFPSYLVYDPVFNEHLCEVPLDTIKHHYRPVDLLQKLRHQDRLDEVESQALQFIKILKESANVPWSKLGISGSILVRLHTPASDIDPIVYGSETCYKVYSALGSLLESKESPVKPYGLKELKELFDFRSKDTAMRFEDFVRTESRKLLQGKFMGRDYFVRFVKDWNEIEEKYGTILYRPEGYAKIKATVVDDSKAIFTPCCYKIGNLEILEGTRIEAIEEIVSFRGRFCEQAKKGETVIAQGKVEKLQEMGGREHYRLLLGNKVSDHMILA
ncbi:MAG: hypothetical protein ACETVM_02315 [Candidatus Bathyarchaeia archaeon]